MGIWSIDKNQKEQKILWKGTKWKKKESNSQDKARYSSKGKNCV